MWYFMFSVYLLYLQAASAVEVYLDFSVTCIDSFTVYLAMSLIQGRSSLDPTNSVCVGEVLLQKIPETTLLSHTCRN